MTLPSQSRFLTAGSLAIECSHARALAARTSRTRGGSPVPAPPRSDSLASGPVLPLPPESARAPNPPSLNHLRTTPPRSSPHSPSPVPPSRNRLPNPLSRQPLRHMLSPSLISDGPIEADAASRWPLSPFKKAQSATSARLGPGDRAVDLERLERLARAMREQRAAAVVMSGPAPRWRGRGPGRSGCRSPSRSGP